MTQELLEELDRSYESVGLMTFWMGSEQRQQMVIDAEEELARGVGTKEGTPRGPSYI